MKIPDVTEGYHDKNIIKQAIWKEHDREVKALLAGDKKSITYEKTIRQKEIT